MGHIAIRTIAILVTSYITHVGVTLLPTVNTLWVAFLVAVTLAVVNHTIKPILHIVFIPVHLLTLGFSSLIINGMMIIFASHIVPGFLIPNLLMGFWFSCVLSFVNWILHIFERS